MALYNLIFWLIEKIFFFLLFVNFSIPKEWRSRCIVRFKNKVHSLPFSESSTWKCPSWIILTQSHADDIIRKCFSPCSSLKLYKLPFFSQYRFIFGSQILTIGNSIGQFWRGGSGSVFFSSESDNVIDRFYFRGEGLTKFGSLRRKGPI